MARAQADPDVDRLREQIARYSIKAYDRGLVGGAGGNVSARDPETGLVVMARAQQNSHGASPSCLGDSDDRASRCGTDSTHS